MDSWERAAPSPISRHQHRAPILGNGRIAEQVQLWVAIVRKLTRTRRLAAWPLSRRRPDYRLAASTIVVRFMPSPLDLSDRA